MASPFPEPALARLRRIWRQPLALTLVGIALCGCSFDLGSLMPEKDKPQEAPKAATAPDSAVSAGNVTEADPHKAQVWTTRGQAYERLGDKTKAAASYNKAVSLRPRDDAARSGLARVGG